MYNPYGFNQMGYAPQQQPKMTELPKADIERLKELTRGQFTIDLTDVDILVAKCPHRENGAHKLVDNGDGTHTCELCRETFTIFNGTTIEAEQVTQQFLNLLQTIKALNLDIAPQVLEQFMPIIAMSKKVPRLFEHAIQTFNKYDGAMHNTYQVSGMNALNSILGFGGPGYPMQGGYPQGYPMQQQPQQFYQPQGFQQPQPQQFYQAPQPQYQPQGYPVQQQYNPFTGQQAPMQQQYYQPQQDPNQPQQVAQPTQTLEAAKSFNG